MNNVELASIIIAIVAAIASILAAFLSGLASQQLHKSKFLRRQHSALRPATSRTRVRWSIVLVLTVLVSIGNLLVYSYHRLASRPEVSTTVPGEDKVTDFNTNVLTKWRNLTPSSQIWIVVYSRFDDLYFPQTNVAVDKTDGQAVARIEIGAPNDGGRIFEILSVAAAPEAHRALLNYRNDPARAGLLVLPRGVVVFSRLEVSRR